MKIIRLQAANVKKIKAIEIKPDGDVICIGGKNSQGKSSVLDSILYGLTGKRSFDEMPVREGADKAEIEIELDDDFIIKRTIYPDKTTHLTVTSKLGAKYPSPQGLLDSFCDKFAYDPLAFIQYSPKQQVEMLKSICKLDFSELERQSKKAYDDRAFVNRQISELENLIANKPLINDAPEREVSSEEITAEISVIQKQTLEWKNAESKAAIHFEQGKQKTQKIQELKAQIAQLEAEVANHQEQHQTITTWLKENPVPEIEQAYEKLKGIEALNAKWRNNQEHLILKEKLKASKQAASDLTAVITSCQAEKEQALADAELPVPGLSFSEEGVFLGSIPFLQASSAEQLKVSAAMAIALNPTLRIMRIKEGALLDNENRKLLFDIAAKHDCQVWMEVVGEGEDVNVVIEDGQIKK